MRLFALLLFFRLIITPSFSIQPLEDFLLIYTLDGKFTLVNKYTGTIRWTYDSRLTNDCTYSGDVLLIPEIHGGRLYEYSGSESKDVLYRVNSSIFELVARSPETLNSLYTTGYKSDRWLQLDLDTGNLLKSARCFPNSQCYSAHLDDGVNPRILDLGISEYHFMLWDFESLAIKMNMTFQSLPSHIEPDFQTSNLTHIATLESSIVTFNGCKFLWHLPLSAPVVDLFSVEAPPASPSTSSSDEDQFKKVQPDSDEFLPMKRGAKCSATPYRLRRIVFTTYALSLNESYSTSVYPTQSALWEAKLSRDSKFVPSLYVGESSRLPLYIVHTLAEAALKPRHVQRISEHLRLPYEQLADADTNPKPELSHCTRLLMLNAPPREVFWPKSLSGLYLLLPDSPKVNHDWSPPPSSPHRLPLLIGQTHNSGRPLLTMEEPNTLTEGVPKATKITAVIFLTVTVILVSGVISYVFLLRNRAIQNNNAENKTSWGHSSPILHPSFDCADEDGWAGHPASATEAESTTGTSVANPEIVRFNINRILGSGANGTCVFEGTYGDEPVAVKRILRRAELEKSWLRELKILMNHHHEHLIRCFWTGSSSNFHYLVLQRCVTSLLEALDVTENEDISASTAAVPKLQCPLNRFGLTSVQCVEQLLNAVVFLHSKSIVHRDIKPSNIFILESSSPASKNSSAGADAAHRRLVLGDFGLSLRLENGLFTNSLSFDLAPDLSTTRGTYGSLGWMAPEMCTPSKEPLTKSVDVFAFGLVAYFILTHGRHPYYSVSSGLDANPTSSDTDSYLVEKPKHSLRTIYSSLASLQAMQKAIIDQQEPKLNDLVISTSPTAAEGEESAGVEKNSDKMYSCLAKQLIQEALSFDPSVRCSIDVLAGSPLFWPSEAIMAFYMEVSNFMDESKPVKFSTGSGSSRSKPPMTPPALPSNEAVNPAPPVDLFQPLRRSLSSELDHHWSYVFSGSWLRHLDQVITDDLCSVRSYQDRSLTHLLRAIRNKRNHIWSLAPAVRDVLGASDEEIALYWNSKFPSLLPLTYCLARVHLADVDHFRRFLPAPMTPTQAETFIQKYCAPAPPAMWSRMTVSPQTSPTMVRFNVLPRTEPFSRLSASAVDTRGELVTGCLKETSNSENFQVTTKKDPANGSSLKISPKSNNAVDVFCNKITISPVKIQPARQSMSRTPPQSNFWFSPRRQKERNINTEPTPTNALPTVNGNNQGEAVDRMNDQSEEGNDLSDGFMTQTKKKRARKHKNVPKTH